MDFIEQLQDLSKKIEKYKDHCETEETTKMALVVPFIMALGYDPLNPFEVKAEYTADVGTKKSEKVDYAILRDGKLIEVCSDPQT